MTDRLTLKTMSNSIGPCPTELDTLDSNIGAGSRWFEGYTGLIQRHQAACLDHNCAHMTARETTATATGVPLLVATIYAYLCYCPIQLDRGPIGDGPLSVEDEVMRI
jgi:hypothetical protein